MFTYTPISQPIMKMEVGFEKKVYFLTRPNIENKNNNHIYFYIYSPACGK